MKKATLLSFVYVVHGAETHKQCFDPLLKPKKMSDPEMYTMCSHYMCRFLYVWQNLLYECFECLHWIYVCIVDMPLLCNKKLLKTSYVAKH